MKREELISSLEYTILAPNINLTDLHTFKRNIIDYGFKKICIPGYLISNVRSYLKLHKVDVEIVTVIGFPFGYESTDSKVDECKNNMLEGANHIDCVVNISMVKMSNWVYIQKELERLKDMSSKNNVILKIIFENCYLTDDEKMRLCNICNNFKVNYAKTSTGFGTGGAKVDDVKLMRRYLNGDVKIKAAGGIKTLSDVYKMLKAGADVVGVSSGVSIIEEYNSQNPQ